MPGLVYTLHPRWTWLAGCQGPHFLAVPWAGFQGPRLSSALAENGPWAAAHVLPRFSSVAASFVPGEVGGEMIFLTLVSKPCNLDYCIAMFGLAG